MRSGSRAAEVTCGQDPNFVATDAHIRVLLTEAAETYAAQIDLASVLGMALEFGTLSGNESEATADS